MTISATTDLAGLYRRYSARLAAHAAERLAASGADPVDQADDVTQEVWLWAAQQRRLPSWEGLTVMTDWVIEDAKKAQRPEVPAGIRPTGAPVLPVPALQDKRRQLRGAAFTAPLAA